MARTYGLAGAVLLGLALAGGCSSPAPSASKKVGGPTKVEETSASVEAIPIVKAKRPLVVGFSQIGAESGWRTAETKSIQDEAKIRGIDLKFVDAQQKQENQIKAIRGFVAQKVDAIILAPVVETGWDPVLKEAKDAGIPVVLVDRGVKVEDPSLYATKICSDFVEEGRMAANKLIALAKSLKRPVSIAQIEGTTGAAPAIDRKTGFEEIVAKSGDFAISMSQTGDFNRAKGKEVMEAFLKSGKPIDAVYAHNDDMALGAIQAIEESGKKPGKDVLVISVDGVHDAFQAMVDGKLNATVECNPLLGPWAFSAVEAILSGKTLPKKLIVVDKLYAQEDAKKALPTRKY